MGSINARKFQWLGHILRYNSFIQLVLEGVVPRKKEEDSQEQILFHRLEIGFKIY